MCDPDENGKMTTCKQHSQSAKAARDAKADAAYQADRFRRQYGYLGPKLIAALQEIASGHNDPRTFAADILNANDLPHTPRKGIDR